MQDHNNISARFAWDLAWNNRSKVGWCFIWWCFLDDLREKVEIDEISRRQLTSTEGCFTSHNGTSVGIV